MPRTKGNLKKSKNQKTSPEVENETAEEPVVIAKKGRPPVESDELEETPVLIDARPIEDALVEEDLPTEDDDEETGLDEDVIDPFGDKWEA